MTMQPFENSDPSQLPILRDARRAERSRLTGEVRAAIVREQLTGAVQAIRLSNAYKLKNMQLDMHIDLGERIANELETNDNPLTQLALQQAWADWVRTSNSIVASLGRAW